jgi:hypothetical protein
VSLWLLMVSMQLESTLFAIAVIQVKPQLEKVLNLPLDSLTKEIELTQDLLKLFQEYQTSADLLSFDPDLIEFGGVDGDVKVPDMIKAVRSNADKVMAMIKKEQDKQIERERAQQAYEQAKIIQPPPSNIVYATIPMVSRSMAPSIPSQSCMPSMPMKMSAPQPAMKRSAKREVAMDCEEMSAPSPPSAAMSAPTPAAPAADSAPTPSAAHDAATGTAVAKPAEAVKKDVDQTESSVKS